MNKSVLKSVVLAIIMIATLPAIASLYQDGKKLYKEGNYLAALSKFNAAIARNPKAKYYWHQGLAHLKLKNGKDALAALRMAQSKDGAITFTDRAKFNKKMQKALKLLGKSGVRNVIAPVSAGGDKAGSRIKMDMRSRRHFFQDYTGTVGSAAQGKIMRMMHGFSRLRVSARIIFVKKAWIPNLKQFVERVYRGGKREVVIVAHKKGLVVRAGALSKEEVNRAIRPLYGLFMKKPGKGLAKVVQAVGRRMQSKMKRGSGMRRRGMKIIKVPRHRKKSKVWLYVLIGVGALILIIIIIAAVSRSGEDDEEYENAYKQIIEGMGPLADKLQDVQLSLRIVHDDDAAMYVSRADNGYFEANGLLEKLPKPDDDTDLSAARRALGAIQESMENLEKADRIIQAKAEGKDLKEEKKKILAEGTSKQGCYFCSRPIPTKADGHMVGINVQGKKMEVIACHECYKKHKSGNPPKVRQVNYKGKNVHWMMVPGYDPYYDFYHYDRYAPSFLDLVLLHTIFDFDYYQHHYSDFDYFVVHDDDYSFGDNADYFDVDAGFESGGFGDTGDDFGDSGDDFGGGGDDSFGDAS